MGSIPGQGAYERQTTSVSHINVSLSPSTPLSLPPSLPSSLRSINISLGEDFKNLNGHQRAWHSAWYTVGDQYMLPSLST